MEKHKIKIYRAAAMVEFDVEAEDHLDALNVAYDMLYEGDGRYSDIDEADFKDPDREFVITVEVPVKEAD